MNSFFKIAVASATLFFAGNALALDQSGVPAQPPPIPGGGLVADNNANGPLFVAVYDPVTGSSLVQYLGLGFSQIAPSDLVNDLNFGVLGGFGTTFASAISAGEQTRLRYQVFSFDDQPSGGGAPEGKGIRTTLGDGTQLGADLGGNVASAINSMRAWISNVVNNVDQCNKQNPCSVIGNSSSPLYWNGTLYGEQYGGSLTESGAGNLGTALAFFSIAVGALDDTTFEYPITQQAYSGVFLLSASGQLIYDVPGGQPVPLPAAVWLLMSGLAGFGVVSRRRKADPAIAA